MMDYSRTPSCVTACLFATVIAFCSTFGVGCQQRSADVTVIKLAHGLDQGHPVHLAMMHFAQSLAEKSDNTIRVDIYSGGQLGGERECLELLQIDGLGMTKVSTGVLESFAPAFAVFSQPYLFRDEVHSHAVLDGSLGQEILRKAEPIRLHGLCYYDAGARSFYTVEKPVTSPEDLLGLKIRVQESPTAVRMVRALGGSPTPISWGELYTALQQGVIDGAENNLPSFYLSKHYEICGHYSLSEHVYMPDVLVMSLRLWQRLTPQQQSWVNEAVRESAILQRELWRQITEETLAVMEAEGVKIIRPDKEPFRAHVHVLEESLKQQQPEVAELARRIREVQL